MLNSKPVKGWHRFRSMNCYFQSVETTTFIRLKNGSVHVVEPHINSYYIRSYESVVAIYDYVTNTLYELPYAHYSRTTAKQITVFCNYLCQGMYKSRFTLYPTIARELGCTEYRLFGWNSYSDVAVLEF